MLTALDLAVCSEAAYDDPATYSIKNHQATLFKDFEGFRIFGIRGTEKDFEDILTDIRTSVRLDSDIGLGHWGFQRGAIDLWTLLEADVVEAFALGLRVVWTGHSLGGAIATNCAGLCIRRGFGVPYALVTYGSPRVGWFGGLNKILKPIPVRMRFRNGNDEVPRHPWPIWGFRHVDFLDELVSPPNLWINHRIGRYAKRLREVEPIYLVP